ncbi:MAG: hypothetical protein OEX12_14015 [Gammaproteobacteria bacterium]|nr:hypothetical protein [Gammaproteobacteria bacterium]
MDYSAIHQALKDEGLTWAMAAEAIGCSPHHLMNVSARRAESRPAAVALSALIHLDVAVVFPDVPRYQVDQKAARKERLAAAKAQLEEAGLRVA